MGNGKPQRKANQTRLNSPILPTVEMGSSGRNHLQVHESYGASPKSASRTRRALERANAFIRFAMLRKLVWGPIGHPSVRPLVDLDQRTRLRTTELVAPSGRKYSGLRAWDPPSRRKRSTEKERKKRHGTGKPSTITRCPHSDQRGPLLSTGGRHYHHYY
jgi:hypothetical protein